MHRFKFFTLFLVFGLLFTVSSDPAYGFQPDPKEEIIAISLLATERSDVEVGSLIDIYINIKNFANFTLNNVTIFQSLDSDSVLQFTESPVGFFNGTGRNYTDVSVINYISGNNLTVNTFDITPSNFTLNIDKIDINQEFSLKFKVNVTDSGLIRIPETTLTYYDQYGDKVPSLTSANEIEIRSIDIPSNEKEGFFPEIDVDEVNYKTILLVSLLLLAVALLGRLSYKKKPIE